MSFAEICFAMVSTISHQTPYPSGPCSANSLANFSSLDESLKCLNHLKSHPHNGDCLPTVMSENTRPSTGRVGRTGEGQGFEPVGCQQKLIVNAPPTDTFNR
jgi:hypothetical protein